jgi:HSP20 family protein
MERNATQTPSREPAAVESREGGELPVKEKHAVTRDPGTHEGSYFEPAVDIYETEEALTLNADVPGAVAEDIQTDLKDNLLTITARLGPLDSRWRPLYQEFETGHYVRQFRLGQQIDQSKISAQLKDGVLTLTLPKAERARARRIEIKHG